MSENIPNADNRRSQVAYVARGGIAIGVFANGRFLSIGLHAVSTLCAVGVFAMAPVAVSFLGFSFSCPLLSRLQTKTRDEMLQGSVLPTDGIAGLRMTQPGSTVKKQMIGFRTPASSTALELQIQFRDPTLFAVRLHPQLGIAIRRQNRCNSKL